MKHNVVSIVLALGLLSAGMAPAASAAVCSAQYTVLPGDNLFRIGLAFGVPWPDIATANSLSNPSLIFPGQVLCIPAGPGTPAPTATGPTPTPGDTLTPTSGDTSTPTPGDTLTPTSGDTSTPTPGDTLTPTPGDTSTPTSGDTSTPTPTATGLPTPIATPTMVPPPVFVPPTFTIVSVVKDTSVTIQTANFPANQDFVVTLGPISGMGVGGTVVTTTNSAQGGVFTTTFSIPTALAGTPQIAIRLQSASGYYAFNWFWNATAP